MSYNRGKNFHKNRFKNIKGISDGTWKSEFMYNNLYTQEELREREEQRLTDQRERRGIEEVRVKLAETPIEEVSFTQIYELPLRQDKRSHWVYDQKGNFVFQFETDDRILREGLMMIINGEMDAVAKDVRLYRGEVYIDNESVITIRGWGNLTGVGAYALTEAIAGRVQDTFGEYLVNKLTKK